MKLTIAASLFLAVATSVQASSLRVQKASVNNKNYGKILNSEVILQGTVGEPTASDMEFIGKALVASYNDVHWEVGHYMTGAHAVDFRGPEGFLCRHCPDDDAQAAEASTANVFEVRTPVGFLCRHCPDDDAMGALGESLLMTALTGDCAGLCQKDAAAELEVRFCDKIRSSNHGSYLASAKSCAIRFDSKNSESGSKKNTVPSASTPVATLDSTIVLKGVGAGDATQEERAVLAKAFVSAYNDVHWGANHYLADAEISLLATKSNPDGFLCRHCPDDDSMGTAKTSTMILDIVTPVEAFLCRHCPDDDAMGNNGFNAASLESSVFDKKALEVAFCRKVQNNSVSPKLAATKTCSVAVETVIA